MKEKEIIKECNELARNEFRELANCWDEEYAKKAVQGLLDLYNKEKESIKYAKEYIKENTHEFYCKRDGLIELTFDANTNATDLIDILEGNY